MAGPPAVAAAARLPAAPRCDAAPGRGAGLRLFVAVALPPGPAAHLAAALGREPDPRWHLTLAFLGERPDPAPVVRALAAVPFTPFRLALAGAGTFGGGRVLWVGVGEGAGPLTALADRVAAACRVDDGRPYAPHLTVRRGRGLEPGPLAGYAGPAFDVDGYGLLESRAGRYLPVAAWPWTAPPVRT